MAKITSYVILQETDPNELSTRVNEYLELGWEVYGNLIITPGEIYNYDIDTRKYELYYSQALTRKD